MNNQNLISQFLSILRHLHHKGHLKYFIDFLIYHLPLFITLVINRQNYCLIGFQTSRSKSLLMGLQLLLVFINSNLAHEVFCCMLQITLLCQNFVFCSLDFFLPFTNLLCLIIIYLLLVFLFILLLFEILFIFIGVVEMFFPLFL